jgi:hypothetical protein
MKPSVKSFAFLMALISLTVLACSITGLFQEEKVNKYPPNTTKAYQEQKTDEDKKRYVITDMQLGGKPVEDYYRQYASQDTVIQQAITLYDNDVRIINIYQFNRVQINNEWTVIYGGSDNVILQGNDVVLTNDIGGGADVFDTRLKYMLADMQLGNVVEYYRQYTDDLAVATAVKWWDVGVRVENIAEFDRVIVNTSGWKVVYIGTENTVNSSDIKLVDAYQAQISYILADMQLGDVFDYYNARTNESAVAEAVSLWNQDVRVDNIKDFDRKIVGELGWKVTYKGTNIPIYGTEIKMPVAVQPQNKCAEPGWLWGVSIPDNTPSNIRRVYKGIIAGQNGEYDIYELSNTQIDEYCNVYYDSKLTKVNNSGRVVQEYLGWPWMPDVGFLPMFSNPIPSKIKIGDSVKAMLEIFDFQLVAIEKVSVPAGTFETYRFEGIIHHNYDTSKYVSWSENKHVYWLSKGIGVIKFEHTYSDSTQNYAPSTIELIEFSGGGQSSPSAFNEAQVRYILADSQLGGIDYYRQFLDQPAVAEAVRRWDAGVRVTNINQFERKIVGDKGWQIVYVGTDTLIDGMDVRLTTDP